MTLPAVDGSQKHRGFMYYCCWPCVCDTQDFIRVDTKTIATSDGSQMYYVAVIGNPCDKPSSLTEPLTQPFDGRRTTIAEAAPEVECTRDGKLVGATMSDNGFVIISLFFNASHKITDFQDDTDFESMCEDRKNQGYNSGMGEIFRRVAAISPVDGQSRLKKFSAWRVKELRQEAVKLGLDTRGVADKADLVQLLENNQVRHMQKMTAKQLRSEAYRLKLDLRGVAEKSELLALVKGALVSSVTADEVPSDSEPETAQQNDVSVQPDLCQVGRRVR